MSSTRFALLTVLLLAASAPAALAQRWEVGAGGAGSFYTTRTATGPYGSADATFKPGGGFYASVAQVGNRFGGELRYTYLMNDMELKSSNGTTKLGGRSNSFEYNFHYYTKDIESTVRPYIIAGGGVRFFTGTGPDQAIQPTMNVAVLTMTTQLAPVINGGAGVRVNIARHLALRAEFKAAFTPVPTEIMTPTFGASLGGWFVNFLPMVGISYEW